MWDTISRNIKFLHYKRSGFKLRNSVWIFIILFVGISFSYRFHKILFFPPQSVHQWRQCDCLSITKNFYEEGLDFFNPTVHCQLSDGGKSGKVVSELPIIYFFVALLWKIFGEHEFIFRLVNLLLAVLGLFAFFKILEGLLKDTFWAVVISLLFYTSPMFAYYANNFLSNVPALSMALIGWYFFYQFYTKSKNKWLYLTMVFFLLGGLLKITAGMSFVVLCFIYLTELSGISRFRGQKKIFKQPLKQIIPFIIVLICLVSWYTYARVYNQKHGIVLFLTSIWPIWHVDAEHIRKTWENVKILWVNAYFNKTVLSLAAVFFILILFRHRRINKFFLTGTILLFIGSIAYLILWFYAIKDHDYYIINLLILIVFIFVTFFYYLKSNHLKYFCSPVFKVVFLLFLCYNIYYCSNQIYDRYWGGWNNNWGRSDKFNKQDFVTITPYLRELNIKRTDKVISIPDLSVNISLYFMDQKGWTSFGNSKYDSTIIAEKIKLGARYLIINDSTLYKEDFLQPFINQKTGSYKSIDIYDLRKMSDMKFD